jgi:hypothetical protein
MLLFYFEMFLLFTARISQIFQLAQFRGYTAYTKLRENTVQHLSPNWITGFGNTFVKLYTFFVVDLGIVFSNHPLLQCILLSV